MFKFFRGRGSSVSAERLKQQKDLFSFNKTSVHGFPYQPTCLAFDNILNILAIGTQNGFIHLVGRPGVEITAQHNNNEKIKSILFLEGRGQIITLTDDYTLHLWQLNHKSDIIEKQNPVDTAAETTAVPATATEATSNAETVENNNAETDVNNKDADDKDIKVEEKINDVNNVEYKYSYLEKVKENVNFNKDKRESNLKDITTLTACIDNNSLYIGTSSGNVYIIDLTTFEQTDQVIYQDVVIQNMTINSEHLEGDQLTAGNKNPGAVEVISVQPNDSTKILIGYEKGLIVLWNNKSLISERTYSINQQLESISWLNNGEKFVSSHNDGSHVIWHVNELRLPSESQKTIYGPFSCKPIKKIVWKTVKDDDDLLILTGGMPRSAHGDKNTVSIIQGNPDTGKHHVIELTSKIIDFFVIDEKDDQYDNSKALIILAEKEIVAIDLRDPDWLQFRLPYFSCIDLSVITYSEYYCNVSDDIINKLIASENEKTGTKFSSRQWPIIGGRYSVKNEEFIEVKDLLITGHEDGGVRFWLTGNNNLQHLYTINTSKLFISMDEGIAPIDGDDIPADEADGNESEWPPFRKIGVYDPCTDDVRLAVRKILFNVQNGQLIVAGKSGQIIIFELNDEKTGKPLSVVSANILQENENFIWKGLTNLTPVNGIIKFEIGYQPKTIIQIHPPAAVTAITECLKWSLLAAGTSHGFILFDLNQSKVVTMKSTMQVSEHENEDGASTVPRSKSFRKSLRESFRRLRKRRTQSVEKSVSSASPSSSPSKESGTKSPIKSDSEKAGTFDRLLADKPVETLLPSAIRCLHFSKVCISANAEDTPTLWVGTNSGLVSVYALTIPSDDKRAENELKCELAKEFSLKHKAPVIYIQIVNAEGPIDLEETEKVEEQSKSNEESTNDQITTPAQQQKTAHVSNKALICSEEQFKLFNLPSFKPYCKSKVGAHNVSKVLRINISKFISKSNKDHTEHCLTALVSDGNIIVIKLIELLKQIQTQQFKKEDTLGLNSLVFTDNGNGLYLSSSSEFQFFTLSAKYHNESTSYADIEIAEGVRPVVQETTVSKESSAEVSKEEEKPMEVSVVVEEESTKADETKKKIEEKPAEVDVDKDKDNEKEQEKDSKQTVKVEKEKAKEKEKKQEKKKDNKKKSKKDKKAEKKKQKSIDDDDNTIEDTLKKQEIQPIEEVKEEMKDEEKKSDELKKEDIEEKVEKTLNGVNNKTEIIETNNVSVTEKIVTQTEKIVTEKISEHLEQKTSTPIKQSMKTTTTTTTKVINGSNDKTNGLLDSSILSDIEPQDMSIESVKDYMNNLNLNDSSDLKAEVIKDESSKPIINTYED